MKKFLGQIGLGFIKLAIAFVVLAIGARFFEPINWFFFQKNDHDRVFFTLMETEKALAEGKKFDVLIFGSSTCENALDPVAFSELTGLSVFKFVTGAQTLDISARIATYLAPKFEPKYILIDGYPRLGKGVTEEGIERAVINAPDATTELTRTILSVDPTSPTTDYLWAARAIGTGIKPYDQSSINPKPHEFVMVAPGYATVTVDPPASPGSFEFTPYPYIATQLLEELYDSLTKAGHQMILILPPLQNALIRFESAPKFPVITPNPRPDTCFFDRKHLRKVCAGPYTQELAVRFNAMRKVLPNLDK
ncbi:MAG: hypothetical protein IPN95_02105 [Bacteroidetes bacterium]|jgi:hypothetical protein|nr:hypothetical protein [Bacteroidota bacterium]MBP6639971.1 hypothetical protein [Bacteroidia bacterium]